MPLLAVQNPGKRTVERTETHVLYGFDAGRTDRGPSASSEPRYWERQGGKGNQTTVLIKYVGGSTPEHDYVIRSRSRDRSFSA